MNLKNAVPPETPTQLVLMVRMTSLDVAHMTLICQTPLTAADLHTPMRNLLTTTLPLENVLLHLYHHAHVKDAVTSTAVMNWITSCTKLTMNITTLYMTLSVDSMMTGMLTSEAGGTLLLTVLLENIKYCHDEILMAY